jgi:hypothetical protein
MSRHKGCAPKSLKAEGMALDATRYSPNIEFALIRRTDHCPKGRATLGRSVPLTWVLQPLLDMSRITGLVSSRHTLSIHIDAGLIQIEMCAPKS